MSTFARTFVVAALFCGIFLVAGVRSKAHAQLLPGGNFGASCTNVRIENAILHGDCRAINGSIKQAQLRNYYLCMTDVENNDGDLVCVHYDKPLVERAAQVLNDAMRAEIGRQLLMASADQAAKDPKSELLRLLDIVHRDKTGVMPLSYVKFLSPEIARKVVAMFVSGPANEALRSEGINFAYFTVHGNKATPEQTAQWNSQNGADGLWIGAEGIINSLTATLNSSATNRHTVIHQVYVMSMGRVANDGDLAYWTPRKETYTAMLAAARNYLYSPAGLDERRKVVRLALKQINKTEPDDTTVNTSMTLFASSKMIYCEMVGTCLK